MKSIIDANQKGFASFLVTVLVLTVVLGIGAAIFTFTHNEQRSVRDILRSSQAYYAAEAGVEDALLRLVSDMNWTNPLTYSLEQAEATTTISDVLGGARTITSKGDALGRLRTVQVSYEVAAEDASFYYGAQVGEGGLILDNLSSIQGNIFSNGSIIAETDTEITGTAKVAQTGNKIQGATIGEDAYVDMCENSSVSGTLTRRTQTGCSASLVEELAEEIATGSLPISQEQINKWQAEASSGGTITGGYTLGSGTAYLGPKKIVGNMLIEGNAQLFVTGTLWVTGSITVKNNARVSLDPASYGSLSGVIISDGLITLENNSISRGSGQSGSYLMYISTATLNPAIVTKNNAQLDILFTSQGWIEIQNNTTLREINGYGIHLKNNAEIIYEVGLQDVQFTSGPGGSWQVTGWQEIE